MHMDSNICIPYGDQHLSALQAVCNCWTVLRAYGYHVKDLCGVGFKYNGKADSGGPN